MNSSLNFPPRSAAPAIKETSTATEAPSTGHLRRVTNVPHRWNKDDDDAEVPVGVDVMETNASLVSELRFRFLTNVTGIPVLGKPYAPRVTST